MTARGLEDGKDDLPPFTRQLRRQRLAALVADIDNTRLKAKIEDEVPDKSRGGHVFLSRLGPGKTLLKCISPPYAKANSMRRQSMAFTPPPACVAT